MATILNNNHPSLMDLIKAENWDGATEKVLGELLLVDSYMQSVPWFPTSHGMKHKDLKASKLGSGDFVSANKGIGTTSSDVETFEQSVVYYSVISQVDNVVFKSGTGEQAWKLRAEQDELNMTGFTQNFTKKIFYGKTSEDPAGLNGLAIRRNDKSSKYVFDAGQTSGSATSVYLMEFGKAGVNMRHQPGKSGFTRTDRGMKSYLQSDGKVIDYWEMQYELWSLLDVFDDRALIRYANINPEGTTNGIVLSDFISMKNTLPHFGKNAAAFVNRSIITQAEIALLDKDNVSYTKDEIENYGPVVKLMGIPLLLQDCISDSEDIVA